MIRTLVGWLACILVFEAGASAEGVTKVPSADAFGSGTSLTRVGSMEFEPFDSDATFNDIGNLPGTTVSRFPTSVTFLQAIVHLPSGALVTGVDLNYCDTSGTQDVGLKVMAGSWDGTGLAQIGVVTSGGASGGCGSSFVDVSGQGFVVDNASNQLLLIATFGAIDGSNAISGAVVHYQLQVSLAPVTATFGDVPTSHPFFRFIEALAASGITGGCGGGNYCPDNAVTRGQMAVFLARALGLQFP